MLYCVRLEICACLQFFFILNVRWEFDCGGSGVAAAAAAVVVFLTEIPVCARYEGGNLSLSINVINICYGISHTCNQFNYGSRVLLLRSDWEWKTNDSAWLEAPAPKCRLFLKNEISKQPSCHCCCFFSSVIWVRGFFAHFSSRIAFFLHLQNWTTGNA